LVSPVEPILARTDQLMDEMDAMLEETVDLQTMELHD